MKRNKIGILFYSIFVSVFCLAKTRKKLFFGSVAVIIALTVTVTCLANEGIVKRNKKEPKKAESKISTSSVSKEVKKTEEKPQPVVKEEPKPESKVESQPIQTNPPAEIDRIKQQNIHVATGGKANTNPEDNDFLDALAYCGYNLQKHRRDGLMWTYILSTDKKHRNWLSKITYGGGCSGYETVGGKPNITRFEQGGLVCASYAAYVYFNYLPNIAGIDTSYLDKPSKSYDANAWYIMGQQWVKKGYSRYIKWTAKSSGTRTVFSPAESVPIGSLMLLQDFNHRNGHCTHICLYAGYKNGYHWVTHVGNENGPEFCAMERMSCGPDPQWPLAIITTPKGIVKN